jgi:hypothetical protein
MSKHESVQFKSYQIEIVAKDPATPSQTRPLVTFRHQGKTLVIGEKGQEYVVQIRNTTAARIEAVVSVDGLDAITGKKASVHSPGYVIDAWSSVDIAGFRLSDQKVAAFTFSDVDGSYAAKSGSGTQSVGVIGVAIYREKPSVPSFTLTTTTVDHRWIPPRYPSNPFMVYYGCQPSVTVAYGPPEAYKGVLSGDWVDIHGQTNRCGGPSSGISSFLRSNDDVLTLLGTVASNVASADSPSVNCVTTADSELPTTDSVSLGTAFGREVESGVTTVDFVRETRNPHEIVRIHYDSRDGFVRMGIPLPELSETEVKDRLSADPFPATPKKDYCKPPEGWVR